MPLRDQPCPPEPQRLVHTRSQVPGWFIRLLGSTARPLLGGHLSSLSKATQTRASWPPQPPPQSHPHHSTVAGFHEPQGWRKMEISSLLFLHPRKQNPREGSHLAQCHTANGQDCNLDIWISPEIQAAVGGGPLGSHKAEPERQMLWKNQPRFLLSYGSVYPEKL